MLLFVYLWLILASFTHVLVEANLDDYHQFINDEASCKDECQHHKPKRPHILFLMSDDMGWNDIGWNNPKIKSPNIDKLAKDGVILNNYYAQSMCTPTRAALLTGTYPFRFGLQQVFDNSQPVGLPIGLTTLPEMMRNLGYYPQLVGKWHLGHCKNEYMPLKRGFNSFFGYYGPAICWFTHKFFLGTLGKNKMIYDFRDNTGIVRDNATHLEYLMRERAMDIIQNLPADQSLLLFYFTGMPHAPLHVPKKYTSLYDPVDVPNENRRKFSGMVSLFDETVGTLVQSLKDKGIWNDTLLVFVSDNGGDIVNSGSNFPLRGGKGYLYEGGSRVPAMVHGKMIQKTGYRNQELFHVTDWFNTLISAAGGIPVSDMDSVDQMETLMTGKTSNRNTVIYNYNLMKECNCSAIRVGNYKLVRGNPKVSDFGAKHGFFNEMTEDELMEKYELTSWDVTELYNLEDDPEEKYNIADSEPDILSSLSKQLDELEGQAAPTVIREEVNPAELFVNCGGILSPGWC